jgi:hypothetical protein
VERPSKVTWKDAGRNNIESIVVLQLLDRITSLKGLASGDCQRRDDGVTSRRGLVYALLLLILRIR